MANHVYFNIEITGVDESEWEQTILSEEVVRKNYKDEDYTMLEPLELEKQPFMQGCNPTFDDNGYLEGSWDWYVHNVGAKWCHIESWEYCFLSGHSAWSQPSEMVENLVEYFSMTYGKEVQAKMTFEDEFRNFVGVQWFESYKVDEEWAVAIDEHIIDGGDINEKVQANYEIDIEDEDFDWWEDYTDVNGDTTNPQEYADELVYAFFENGEWR